MITLQDGALNRLVNLYRGQGGALNLEGGKGMVCFEASGKAPDLDSDLVDIRSLLRLSDNILCGEPRAWSLLSARESSHPNSSLPPRLLDANTLVLFLRRAD